MKPYYENENGKLYHGDCLEIIPTLEKIDLTIADPPYSSGGQFKGDRSLPPSTKYVNSDSDITCRIEFEGDNRDQRSFLSWSTMWLGKCYDITKNGGTCLVYTDWRQLPTITDAVQCGGYIWRNIVTWWKPGIRMQRGRFSSSSEYIIYSSKGIPTPGIKSPQNVISNRPVSGKDKNHIAEKPIGLIQELLGILPTGGVVLDPFFGSGSTGMACDGMNIKWIGIEKSELNCEISAKRIEKETRQLKLFK